jgi:hypothetical protein
MPIGVCLHCQRRFVIEDARSFQRTCPCCLRPMQILAEEALPPSLPSSPPLYPPPEKESSLYLDGTPLAANELGQRLMAVMAEAAYQREIARTMKQAARERRGEPELTTEEISPAVPSPCREEPLDDPGPGAGISRSGLIQQADTLQQRGRDLIERAQWACLDAKIIQGRARVAREDRRSRRDPLSLLPALDYVIAAWDDLLPPLAPEGEITDLTAALPFPERAAEAVTTTLYVWGYEPPQSLLCSDFCEVTEAAAQFAAESGWDPDQPGAWAKEIRLPWDLSRALRQAEPILRADPGVGGWGMRLERTD